jgi:hypothetical protein
VGFILRLARRQVNEEAETRAAIEAELRKEEMGDQ